MVVEFVGWVNQYDSPNSNPPGPTAERLPLVKCPPARFRPVRASVWAAAFAIGLAAQVQAATPGQFAPASRFGAAPSAGGRSYGAASLGIGRPAVSPYLNILRNDGLGPLNYQTLVRPQIEARNAYLRQGAEIRGLESEMRNRRRPDDQPGAIRQTGHGTSFFNYSHYFNYPGVAD